MRGLRLGVNTGKGKKGTGMNSISELHYIEVSGNRLPPTHLLSNYPLLTEIAQRLTGLSPSASDCLQILRQWQERLVNQNCKWNTVYRLSGKADANKFGDIFGACSAIMDPAEKVE